MMNRCSSLEAARTLVDLFTWRVATSPDAAAYQQFDASADQWQVVSWSEMAQRVMRWSAAMGALGLSARARVGILLPNGLAAVSADLAAMSQGWVPVPMHAIDNPASVAYILADSQAELLVVAAAAQWQAIAGVGLPLPSLRAVVLVDGAWAAGEPAFGQTELLTLADWLARVPVADGRPQVDTGQAPPAEEDLAAVVYTSGTTGKPKGVMLTHGNVLSNVKAVLTKVAPHERDVFLSFLPLSHTFERTAGYYLPMAAGARVVYARSVALLAEDLRQVQPTVLISVPRIYERVHAKIQEMLATSPVKARVFAQAEAVGWRRFCRRQGLPLDPSPWAWLDGLLWPVLRTMAAEPLLAQFGGRLRVAVSGGAPLSPTLARSFLGLGLPLLQGYGMTETSPIVACNTIDDNDPFTVGRPLPGVEVRIGESRELQVRGPGVMRGYLNRPDDTARVLSGDGWLGTGDQASIEQGRVRILGRIKEIIVTSTGEKVPPGDLELAITSDPLFAQAFVVGENRPFIAAVVVLHAPEWQRLAASMSLDPSDPASLGSADACRAALARIATAAASFPRYAVPRAVVLTLEAWTIENTMMTPTLKLKRNNLMTRFGVEIERLYQC